MKKEYIINACLYQLGWFSCMLLPESFLGLLITLICVGVHLKFRAKWMNEIIFISIGTTLGYAMDFGMNYFNFMNITNDSNNSFYLVLIWVLFSTSLRSSTCFIFKKAHYCLILGAIAPIAYVGGQVLGRIKYTAPEVFSLAIHAIIWILTMLALFYLNKKFPVHQQ